MSCWTDSAKRSYAVWTGSRCLYVCCMHVFPAVYIPVEHRAVLWVELRATHGGVPIPHLGYRSRLGSRWRVRHLHSPGGDIQRCSISHIREGTFCQQSCSLICNHRCQAGTSRYIRIMHDQFPWKVVCDVFISRIRANGRDVGYDCIRRSTVWISQ